MTIRQAPDWLIKARKESMQNQELDRKMELHKKVSFSRIYDLLEETCGAPPSQKEAFMEYALSENPTEWRFSGKLGFGGKLWFNRIPPVINCYAEDLTIERQNLIEEVNAKIYNILF